MPIATGLESVWLSLVLGRGAVLGTESRMVLAQRDAALHRRTCLAKSPLLLCGRTTTGSCNVMMTHILCHVVSENMYLILRYF